MVPTAATFRLWPNLPLFRAAIGNVANEAALLIEGL